MRSCDCGATDCRACHPENWEDGVYLGDLDEDDAEDQRRARLRLEYAAEARYEARHAGEGGE